NYTAAERLYRQALKIDRKVLGKNHPAYIKVLKELKRMHKERSKVAAEAVKKRSVPVAPSSAGFQEQLALLGQQVAHLYQRGQYERAMELAVRACDLARVPRGERHPAFAANLNNLALLYQARGNYTAAEPLYCQAQEIARAVLGEEHPNFATSLNC